jgi:hypothetical protein
LTQGARGDVHCLVASAPARASSRLGGGRKVRQIWNHRFRRRERYSACPRVKVRLIAYRHNLVPVLAYWPVLLGSLLVVTLIVFFRY